LADAGTSTPGSAISAVTRDLHPAGRHAFSALEVAALDRLDDVARRTAR
jgi:hypothetical protein